MLGKTRINYLFKNWIKVAVYTVLSIALFVAGTIIALFIIFVPAYHGVDMDVILFAYILLNVFCFFKYILSRSAVQKDLKIFLEKEGLGEYKTNS